MKEYNQWTKSVNFGAHYVPPTPPASGHYWDSSVYLKSKNVSIMKLFKRLLGFFLFTLTLASCARTYSPYKAANTGGLKCSKWNRIK